MAFRAATTAKTNQNSTGNSITLGKPTGVVQGDFMLAVLNAMAWSYPLYSVPTGWTLLDVAVSNAGGNGRVFVYYKLAGASEPASYTWTINPDYYFFGSGSIVAYSGVDSSYPINQHAASATANAATSSATPTITPNVPNTMIVSWWGNIRPGNLTVTTPASDTLRAAPVDSTIERGAVSDQAQASAAAVTRTATFSAATTEGSAAGIVALAPAGAAIPGPGNTALPSITGTAIEAQVLTGSDGTWTGSPTSYTRQWRRCDSGGFSCVDISGATGSTYTLVAADGGSTIRLSVTATNAGGSTSASSAATVVVKRPPLNTSPPTVSGATTQAWTLTTNEGSWTNTPSSYSYQWRQCDSAGQNCTDITGATEYTYAATPADVGHRIRAVVTAANADGPTSVASAATATIGALVTIAAPDPTLTTQPTQTYNGPYVEAVQWHSTDDGGYELRYQRRTYDDWAGAAVYPCVAYVTWPRNTCGDDGIGYDGRTYNFKSFRQEVWNEFGGTEQTAQSAGYLEARDGNCGDLTGTDAPTSNPCYARVWFDGVDAGQPSADPTATVDATPVVPSAPVPMSPIGPAPSGSYTSEVWTSDEVDNEKGLRVISSTAAGTAAITGIAADNETGTTIGGATVTITCASCNSPSATTTTDASGAFAFIDLPAGTYDLVTTAAGYGTYSLLNGLYAAGEEYEVTIDPTTEAQTYDESLTGELARPSSPITESVIGDSQGQLHYSQTQPPPSFVVRRGKDFLDAKHCVAEDPPDRQLQIRSWSTPFYILHTLHPEVIDVPLTYTAQQMRAYLSIEMNYAWFHKIKGGAFDVWADTRSICFLPARRVSLSEKRLWRQLLDDVLPSRMVVTVNGVEQLKESQFASGLAGEGCEQPTYQLPPDPGEIDYRNHAYQYGFPYLGVPSSHCLTDSDWQKIALHYYTTHPRYVRVAKPANPSAPPVTISSGDIVFNFISSVYGKNVAWSYYLESRPCTMSGPECVASSNTWTRFQTLGWSSKVGDRKVLTSYQYSGASGCRFYHVIAHGPSGNSVATRFTYGGKKWICV